MNTLEIIRELEQDESLRVTLRAVILGDELVGLPSEMRLLTAEVKKLAEAQLRTENAQQRTEETVKELANAQQRTEETVKELANAQQRTEETVKELVLAQLRIEETVKELVLAQLRIEETVKSLELTVRELVAAQLRTENAQQRTEKTVKELVSAQLRIEETVRELKENVDRLNESVGETAEVSCALVLGAMAEERGWIVLDEPAPVAMDEDEVDVRGRFDTPDGEVVVLAEAKSRLQKKYVDRWANRVGDKDWREKFLYPGFNGKVLPYMYGTLIYSGVNERAKEFGIGVITYNGECLTPRPL
ncbi:MAG: hypothetical protein M1399_02595 [Actinobacteria bacterium]|nr:hypothetical protein [Actinomycetota bacterium]MCL5446089.1 hypothetical protein [Actinomycetota bacterium]